MHSEVNIWHLVKNLLRNHNCVVVPNLGGFIGHHQSAVIDPISETITPPFKFITFNSQLTLNDGLLATKIADYLKISYSDSIKIIDEEIANFYQILKNTTHFNIDGLGNFELNNVNKLQFTPEKKANFLIDSFGLDTVKIHSTVELRTTKIIAKNNQLLEVKNESTSHIKSDKTKSNKFVNHSNRNRKNSVLFSVVATVLVLVLGLNAYIFLQEGNLTPIRNKYNELNLGIKLKSAFETNTIDKNTINKNELLKVYNNNSANKKNTFSNDLFPKNETQNVNINSFISAKNKEEIIEAITDTLVENNVSIANDETIIETADETIDGPENKGYYIIAGAFKSERKANKLLAILTTDGFVNAQVIANPNKHKKTLKYLVTYNKFNDLTNTNTELININENENPDAWVLSIK